MAKAEPKKSTMPVTVGGLTHDRIRLAVYKAFKHNRHVSQLDLCSFLSGAITVMNEVFSDSVDSSLGTKAVPKIWYFGDQSRILEQLEKELAEAK